MNKSKIILKNLSSFSDTEDEEVHISHHSTKEKRNCKRKCNKTQIKAEKKQKYNSSKCDSKNTSINETFSSLDEFLVKVTKTVQQKKGNILTNHTNLDNSVNCVNMEPSSSTHNTNCTRHSLNSNKSFLTFEKKNFSTSNKENRDNRKRLILSGNLPMNYNDCYRENCNLSSFSDTEDEEVHISHHSTKEKRNCKRKCNKIQINAEKKQKYNTSKCDSKNTSINETFSSLDEFLVKVITVQQEKSRILTNHTNRDNYVNCVNMEPSSSTHNINYTRDSLNSNKSSLKFEKKNFSTSNKENRDNNLIGNLPMNYNDYYRKICNGTEFVNIFSQFITPSKKISPQSSQTNNNETALRVTLRETLRSHRTNTINIFENKKCELINSNTSIIETCGNMREISEEHHYESLNLSQNETTSFKPECKVEDGQAPLCIRNEIENKVEDDDETPDILKNNFKSIDDDQTPDILINNFEAAEKNINLSENHSVIVLGNCSGMTNIKENMNAIMQMDPQNCQEVNKSKYTFFESNSDPFYDEKIPNDIKCNSNEIFESENINNINEESLDIISTNENENMEARKNPKSTKLIKLKNNERKRVNILESILNHVDHVNEDQDIQLLFQIFHSNDFKLHSNGIGQILEYTLTRYEREQPPICLKKYRKNDLYIYKIKKMEKSREQNTLTINNNDVTNMNIEDFCIKLTQQSFVDDSKSFVSFSTHPSYISDDGLTETLSFESEHLTAAEKRLKNGFDIILRDKSLLFNPNDLDCLPSSKSRKQILSTIECSLFTVINDFNKGRKPSFQYKRQTINNCVFKNNRAIYYQIKCFVKKQTMTDNAINAVSCMLNVGAWDLNIVAQKGLVYGNLLIKLTSGETINCNIPGTLIPMRVKDILELQSPAKFILVVEKESIFHKLIDEDLPNKLRKPFILITGKGFADHNTQLFLKKLWMVMLLPVFILVDPDPQGIQIMLTYRFGSVASAHISRDLAIPKAQWLGVFPSEILRLSLMRTELTDKDKKLTLQLLNTPSVTNNPKIENELRFLLENNCKTDIESFMRNETFLSNIYLTGKFCNHDYF